MGYICCLQCQRYSGHLTPNVPMASRLWETFTFLSMKFVCKTAEIKNDVLLTKRRLFTEYSESSNTSNTSNTIITSNNWDNLSNY